MSRDHCPQRTGSAPQYHLVLTGHIWTGRHHWSRSEHWLPAVCLVGGLLQDYSVLLGWLCISPTCLWRDEHASRILTFPQTTPADDSSCYSWIQCTTACWKTDWSHLMCEGDWRIHCQNGNVIVLKHKVMPDSLYHNTNYKWTWR
jgi:hypothetical protein